MGEKKRGEKGGGERREEGREGRREGSGRVKNYINGVRNVKVRGVPPMTGPVRFIVPSSKVEEFFFWSFKLYLVL